MMLLRMVMATLCVFNALPTCSAAFTNPVDVGGKPPSSENSRSTKFLQKERVDVPTPERALQRLQRRDRDKQRDSLLSEMAKMENPLGVMESSLGSLDNLLSMEEKPTPEDVAKEFAEIGVAIVGAVNPILGIAATFFWGLIDGADKESEAQEFYTKILDAAKNYTDAKVFQDRLRKCCSPGSRLSLILDSLVEGSLLGENDEVDFANRMYEHLRLEQNEVFGECVNGQDADGCRKWQTEGGAPALVSALALATTEVALLQHVIMLSEDPKVKLEARERIAEHGDFYVNLLTKHYDAFKTYRLDQVHGVEGELKKYSRIDTRMNLVYNQWRVKNKDNYGVDDFKSESYLKTCTFTDTSLPRCRCDELTHLRSYPESMAACRKNMGCPAFHESARCYPDPQFTQHVGNPVSCCKGGQPCLALEYETCTGRYKRGLIKAMKKHFQDPIEKLAVIVEHQRKMVKKEYRGEAKGKRVKEGKITKTPPEENAKPLSGPGRGGPM